MSFWDTLGQIGTGLLSGATGGLLNTALGFIGSNRQNKENRHLLDYQYSKNLEQWNRENEYNTPKAQMERLKEAGLNPYLVYGHGTAVTSAASSPQFGSASMEGSKGPGSDPSAALAGAQLADISASARYKESQARQSDVATRNLLLDQNLKILAAEEKNISILQQRLDYYIKSNSSQYLIDSAKEQLNQAKENVKKIKSETWLNYQRADTLFDQAEMYSSVVSLNDVKRRREEFELSLRKEYGHKINDATLSEIYSRIRNLKSQATLNDVLAAIKSTGVDSGVAGIIARLMVKSGFLDIANEAISSLPAPDESNFDGVGKYSFP
ncbi:DNA pilot protein [Sigmofec virus UA08Rod_6151]|uniref:DNA pilot protein n=1 Tax=Sigmofec virus UA08Rod_6151 TaxID=2929224 RepID=A0A976N124_9VIRU|nr:DNA pilot protein [Sigmofec virus UA08Rod_6151]